jgi:hypothetical protein
MNDNTKVRLTIVGFVVLWLLQVGWADAAELRYIRIGEHKTFTRIVFEFRGSAVFKEPVIKGRGRFSVVFVDTTTALPKQILSETTKRVDAIEFVQQGSRLAANVALSFPYFKVKAFTLPNPDRVVLDVNRLSSPPDGVVFEESLSKSLSKEPPAKTLARTGEGKPEAGHEEPLVKKAGKDLEPEQTVVASKPTQEDTQETSAKPSQDIAKQSPAPPKEPPPTPVAEKASSVAVPQDQSPSRPSKYGHLQVYLLAALIVLSLVIISLLSFILLQKRRAVDSDHSGEDSEPLSTAEDSIAAIDEKIEKELKKFDQS